VAHHATVGKAKSLDLLYFEGCPNIDTAGEHARRALAATGISADLRLVRIDNDADAVRQRFLGSPTIRVNGEDVEPSARGRVDFGLQCRVYNVDARLAGAPPVTWIEAALRGDTINTNPEPSTTAGCCSASSTNKAQGD
jgi:hypothetical protein